MSSAYPNWDVADRREDLAKLRRGELVLEEGHETTATTVKDGVYDEVLKMPSDSPWPVVLAAVMFVIFLMLLTSHWVVAGFVALTVLLVLAAWHAREPQEQ